MQLDPQGVAPDDLSHAGSVVDKAIEYMMEQKIAPVSAASALLGGALGLLSRSMDDRSIAGVLRQALASFAALYNASWLRERHGHKTPDQIRAEQKALETKAATRFKLAA